MNVGSPGSSPWPARGKVRSSVLWMSGCLRLALMIPRSDAHSAQLFNMVQTIFYLSAVYDTCGAMVEDEGLYVNR